MEVAVLWLPKSELHFRAAEWVRLVDELHQRTQGYHESGAFLLGRISGRRRLVEEIVFYDDLDSAAYDTGVVVMRAASFGPLWDRCRSSGLQVVADVHVHGGSARQSLADKQNPMIAQKRHLAMILPSMARAPIAGDQIGLYEYRGRHRWKSLGHNRLSSHLIIGP
ncbi:hypothetical protein [Pelagerythrobacter aerophilus]|uniref:JAB domain-containing protein n=1 Tax=Pelagerythrobacter aerophilus TaxID=2306995 RepID=A0A418NL10_9SPHN|nr:hypothetical protein [Pelagerythrobacter aerophilus]RIV80352.1 hypothetical protein D2V04_03415 [Pelagerythrobacter aerophilus]